MFTAEELKKPVDGSDEAVGKNEEYNPLYLELESLCASSPDSDKEPNYRQLEKNCLELWKTTRDLRVASYLTVAGVETNGLTGLAEGLETVRWLIDELWDGFYPRLDPDDDNDPLERLNILAMLSPEPGAFNDPVMFLSKLRQIKLMPRLGYTLRDIMIANGELESEQAVDAKLVAAEMMGCPIEDIKKQAELVAKIDRTIADLCTAMNDKMTGGYSLNMSSLQKEIKRFSSFYQKHSNAFNPEEQEAEAGLPAEENAQDKAASAPVAAVRRGVAVDLASIKASSRAEALLLLKKGAEYFQTEEPTSPVPYLISRALRLSEMNFMDLLADIAPDALARGRDILGVRQDEN